MVCRFSRTEINYIKQFSHYHEGEQRIRFVDANLLDMYTHNFTLIPHTVGQERLREIICEELDRRRQAKEDFLRIELDFAIGNDFLSGLPQVTQITRYDYLYIKPHLGAELPGKEGFVLEKAMSERATRDGIEVDIRANQAGMGLGFATRRIHRKQKVYQHPDTKLDLYVCYFNGTPVGNCEFLVDEDIAKIEDFDILPGFQRRGMGTAAIKQLLQEARNASVQEVYLITDSEDTAQRMYQKCGFKKAAEKVELFFDLS